MTFWCQYTLHRREQTTASGASKSLQSRMCFDGRRRRRWIGAVETCQPFSKAKQVEKLDWCAARRCGFGWISQYSGKDLGTDGLTLPQGLMCRNKEPRRYCDISNFEDIPSPDKLLPAIAATLNQVSLQQHKNNGTGIGHSVGGQFPESLPYSALSALPSIASARRDCGRPATDSPPCIRYWR